jgi:mannose-6-phosphate isomerase-like protein (cupin superfamily)
MADYSMLSVPDVEPEPSTKSGTLHVDLTAELDLEESHAKVWYLSEGDAMSYHRQASQEELYYVLSGPGRMRIDDEYVDVPEGSAVRVAPETPRQVLNDTGGEHVWLIVGAPPAADDGLPPE